MIASAHAGPKRRGPVRYIPLKSMSSDLSGARERNESTRGAEVGEGRAHACGTALGDQERDALGTHKVNLHVNLCGVAGVIGSCAQRARALGPFCCRPRGKRRQEQMVE